MVPLPHWWQDWHQTLPAAMQEHALWLDARLQAASTEITCVQVYGIPFYAHKGKRFAYLNKLKSRAELHLAFTQGWHLEPLPGILLGEDKAQIRYLCFGQKGQPTPELVDTLLAEAVLLAELGTQERRPKP